MKEITISLIELFRNGGYISSVKRIYELGTASLASQRADWLKAQHHFWMADELNTPRISKKWLAKNLNNVRISASWLADASTSLISAALSFSSEGRHYPLLSLLL